MKKSRKFRGNMMSLIGVPEDVAFDLPQINIIGFNKIEIDNYKNIVQFDTEFLKVNTVSGFISLTGSNFSIKEIEFSRLVIKGTIKTIEFEERLD